tara:strand:- start:521 stop:715 length:195 start_codon:yes stop_codon:yes gene_type:complete
MSALFPKSHISRELPRGDMQFLDLQFLDLQFLSTQFLSTQFRKTHLWSTRDNFGFGGGGWTFFV